MTWLYAFMFFAGAPVLLWFVFSGGDADADSGAGDETGLLADVLTFVPLSSLAFIATFFGATGLAAQWAGAPAALAFLVAASVGVAAGAFNSAVFAFLRRSEASSDVSDREIEGSIARVTLPITSEHRGKIMIRVAGAIVQMTAAAVDDLEPGRTIEKDARVIIVRIDEGVALVTRLDPQLE